MHTEAASFTPPEVDVQDDYWGDQGGPSFQLYSPDPYDLPLYCLPIPLDKDQKYTVSASLYADTPVTAGFKLLAWYGTSETGTVPGKAGFQASTVAIRDLADSLTTASVVITAPPGKTWMRVAVEIDTCTANVPGVTTVISRVTMTANPPDLG